MNVLIKALRMFDVTERVLSPEGLPFKVRSEKESLPLPILYLTRGKLNN